MGVLYVEDDDALATLVRKALKRRGHSMVHVANSADALARIGPVSSKTERKRAEVLAVKAAAEALGNTPTVAKSSYIDPRVFTRYRRGQVLDVTVSPESAIRTLLLG